MPRNFATLGPSNYSRRLLGIIEKAKTTLFVNLAALGRRQPQYIFLQIRRDLWIG
jgi:hypothetical protein